MPKWRWPRQRAARVPWPRLLRRRPPLRGLCTGGLVAFELTLYLLAPGCQQRRSLLDPGGPDTEIGSSSGNEPAALVEAPPLLGRHLGHGGSFLIRAVSFRHFSFTQSQSLVEHARYTGGWLATGAYRFCRTTGIAGYSIRHYQLYCSCPDD